MGKLPERKPNRLKEITAVTGSVSVGASVARPPLPVPAPRPVSSSHPLSVHPSRPLPVRPLPAYTYTKLSPIGKIIENEIAVTQSVRARRVRTRRGYGRDEGYGRGGTGGRATLAPTERMEHTVNNILKMSVLFLK